MVVVISISLWIQLQTKCLQSGSLFLRQNCYIKNLCQITVEQLNKVLIVKSDHRSKFSNLSNKLERRSQKKSGLNQRDSNP